MPKNTYHCYACGKYFERSMTVLEREQHPRPICPECKSRDVKPAPAPLQASSSKESRR